MAICSIPHLVIVLLVLDQGDYQECRLTLVLDGPPPLPVGGAPGADQAAGQRDHQTRSEDPEHAAQQHRDPGHQEHDIMTQYVS